MKRNITIVLVFLIVIVCLSLLFLGVNKEKNEMKNKYDQLEEMLIPTTKNGEIDFDTMDFEDHQYLAYCLKAVARLGENKSLVRQLTQYLVDHADDNNDGEIGWGLGYESKWLYTQNPKWQVYAIEVSNVIDAYIEALNSGLLTKKLSNKVKNQLHDIVLLWNEKYWSENGNSGEKYFYWYSTSESDAIGCINIDAKMVGSQARLLEQYGELFTKEEKNLIYNHIDHSYSKIMENSYLENEYIKWNYLENNELDKEYSIINDAIHHGFILEGIYDYQKYRLKESSPLSDNKYTDYIVKCLKDDIIYRYPEYNSYRCFDTGAIRWLPNRITQKEVLLKSFDLYYNNDTNRRQLTFL